MGGIAHSEECRDRAKNGMTTDAGKADDYETAETRRLDLMRLRFETGKLPKSVATVKVGTMGTVQAVG